MINLYVLKWIVLHLIGNFTYQMIYLLRERIGRLPLTITTSVFHICTTAITVSKMEGPYLGPLITSKGYPIASFFLILTMKEERFSSSFFLLIEW